MNLLILGAGGHGHVVAEVARTTDIYERIEFLDDNFDKAIGKLSDYKKYSDEFESAFVAIGNADLRKKWTELIENEYQMPSLIHPKAHVSEMSKIGAGSIILPGAIVQTNAQIGKSCIVSAGAIVDHGACIGDYCHVNAGAIVSAERIIDDMTKVDYGEVYV